MAATSRATAAIGWEVCPRRADRWNGYGRNWAMNRFLTMKLIYYRQTGEHVTGQPIPTLITAGGGTRNRAWLQIKADVSGCRIEASAAPEATLLGAALVAGIGRGLYASEAEAFNGLCLKPVEVFLPDGERHAVYRRLYEQGYLRLQEALSHHFNGKDKEHAEYE